MSEIDLFLQYGLIPMYIKIWVYVVGAICGVASILMK